MPSELRLSTIGLHVQSWRAYTEARESAGVEQRTAAEAWSQEAQRDRLRTSLLHDKAKLLRLLSPNVPSS